MTAGNPQLDGTGWALIGILSVLWGGAFFLIEVGLRSFPPNTLVFARLAIAAPLLLIAMRIAGQVFPKDGKTWVMLTIVGLLNCALPFILFFWGQQYLDSGYAAILNATTPLWGVVIAHLMTTDEKATPLRIGGTVLGLAGIVVMVGPDAVRGLSQNLLAQIACIVSTVFYNFAAIYGRRLGQQQLSPLVIATGQTLTAAVFMLPIMLIVDQPWALPTPRLDATLAALTLAVLSTALAYVLFFRLVDRAGASNSQMVAFLMPVLAVILGITFLGEKLVVAQIGGAILIASGLALIDGRLFTRKQQQPQQA